MAKGDSRGMATEMKRTGKATMPSPAAPPMTEEEMREEMLRHRAEQIVRDGVGKTPGFQREVARVVKELKALERDAGQRIGKG